MTNNTEQWSLIAFPGRHELFIETSVPGTEHLKMNYWTRNTQKHQNNAGYCHYSWLPITIKRSDPATEDTAHFGFRSLRKQSLTDQETPCYMLLLCYKVLCRSLGRKVGHTYYWMVNATIPTCQANCVYSHNNDMVVLNITNHFLIGLWPPNHRKYFISGQNLMVGIVISSSSKSSSASLKKHVARCTIFLIFMFIPIDVC